MGHGEESPDYAHNVIDFAVYYRIDNMVRVESSGCCCTNKN
jgi:hypothetical protein